jgi:hypothetical protein
VSCSFASSDGKFTMGFVLYKNSKPNTLLSGNQLNNAVDVDLILKKDEITIFMKSYTIS